MEINKNNKKVFKRNLKNNEEIYKKKNCKTFYIY